MEQQQLPVNAQDVIRELGVRDYAILQLQTQLNAILAIPGVKEVIEAHQKSQQSGLLVPAPTLLVPDNGEPQPKRRAIKDVPQA